eukprot:1646569-Pyramimonas_sp.AAC.1
MGAQTNRKVSVTVGRNSHTHTQTTGTSMFWSTPLMESRLFVGLLWAGFRSLGAQDRSCLLAC